MIEWLQRTIRKVTPAGGVTTVATPSQDFFFGGIGVDATGTIYLTDSFNHTVGKLNPEGDVVLLARPAVGDGPCRVNKLNATCASAQFCNHHSVNPHFPVAL